MQSNYTSYFESDILEGTQFQRKHKDGKLRKMYSAGGIQDHSSEQETNWDLKDKDKEDFTGI